MNDDPRVELLELCRALRTRLEWHQACGGETLAPASAALRAERQPAGPLPAGPLAGARPAAAEPAPPSRAGEPSERGPRSAAQPLVTRSGGSSERENSERRGPPPDFAAPPSAEPQPSQRVVPAAPASLRLSPDEQRRRLEVVAERVRGCTACALHEGRTNTVFARGTGSSRICFIGEGPGADEDAQGIPFVGKAGQLLDKMIAAMGLGHDEVYVCNIVKCRPPNNRKPEPAEMAACMPYLQEQLEILQPEVIVALGATAVQGLLGTTVGITRLRGRWKLYQGKIAVMPTFHPAYLLRNPGAKRDVWLDLQAVLRQVGRPIPGKS